MKMLLIILVLFLPLASVKAETVEVKIHGMTCSFCVEGLQAELSGLPDVAQVDVSLKNKKVRLVSTGESLDMDRVRNAINDAGFTPIETLHLESEEG